MIWETIKISGDSVLFQSVAASPETERESCRELWAKFLDEVIPAHVGVGWNRIRVEFWEDSSRVLVFPENSGKRDRIEKAIAALHFPWIGKTFDALIDTIEDDEVVAGEMQKLFEDITDTLISEAQAMEKMRNLEVVFFTGSNEEPFRAVTF